MGGVENVDIGRRAIFICFLNKYRDDPVIKMELT